MTAPNPKRQKVARAKLDQLFDESHNVWVIHYSCESFYDRQDGRSPRITSLAVRKLDSGQTSSFSIHQVAERDHVPLGQIETQYDVLEKKMLDEFYTHIGSHRGSKFLHWNMRDINYGFPAIEHRYRVLGGQPVIIDDDKKVDLSRLLIDIYGAGYSGHPRLENLLTMNHIRPLDFLTGAQEAEAFEQQNFVGLHQSTLRKVDVIANIAGRTYDRHLKTSTSWWQMHGGTFYTLCCWLVENKILGLLALIAGLVPFLTGCIALFKWGYSLLSTGS